MTEIIHRCNFCGISDKDQRIVGIDFMQDDYHICQKCVGVVSNIIYEVSVISMRNPRDTTHNGQKGLVTTVREMMKSEVCNL